ncbi:MAG: HAD-IIB family hydrolase, partial [Spirochaetales bacterium]|nr:HAD-IIB family hydrolase [Spirochaetales bacterium]
TFETNKIIFMSPSKDVLKTAMAEIEKKVEKGRITYYSNADFLEMMPSGYDKSSAIDALAKLFDVKLSQIMALGDDYNDVPMLKRAGCSVAMANAVPEAKAAAKYITDTNNNDGVAKAIQKYVFGIDN